MTENFKNSKTKKLLALFLSVMMLSSTAGVLASCDDSTSSDSSSSDSTSESTTVPKDESRINNGSFEFYDKENDLTPIITAPTGWSLTQNSVSGTSSSASDAASGIVDVDNWDEKYGYTAKTLDALKTELKAMSIDTVEANWEEMSLTEKLAFYEVYDPDTNNDVKLKDLDFYQAFNIDLDDLPDCENPGKHDNAANDDNSVLMIHNQKTGNRGTAQKFTSSSTITLEAGMSATVSVWVKTANLQYGSTDGDADNAQDVYSDRGAYIGITHAIGGKTLDQFQVKNIVEDDWQKYTFHLKGSSYASSTFTMVLGLGQGGGLDRWEHVNGYAFFDDVTAETYLHKDLSTGLPTVYLETEAEDKIFDAGEEDREFAIDLYSNFDEYTLSNPEIALTEETYQSKTYVSGTGVQNPNNYPVYSSIGAGFDTTNDKPVYDTVSNLDQTGNKYLQSIYDKDFKENTFVKATDKVLMLMSASGASYTAKVTDAKFSLEADSRIAISFFVKTSDVKSYTGAGITLKEIGNANSSAFSSLNTTSITPVSVGEGANKIEDVYDGWQQCFFFVENPTETKVEFALSFTYGPTTIIDQTKDSFYPGYAAFAKFEVFENMNEAYFDYASSGTYTKKVTLVGNSEKTGDSGFDSTATVPSEANSHIEDGFATPKNYTGVVGGSGYIVKGGENVDTNKNAYAGLLHKDYISDYQTQAWASGLNLTDLFGDATQPLFIYNNEAQAYGYIGQTQTLSAGSYLALSLRVKVSENATANVYLVDMSDTDNKSELSVSRRLSYWYDANHNVCAKDPTSHNFNEKTDIAFKYDEATGLYKVNTSWSGYDKTKHRTDVYYANLNAYSEDADGNKLVAEGGVSYDYTNYWNNDGVSGKAFYKHEGKYYADSAYKLEVEQLDMSIARYNAINGKNAKTLSVAVSNTNGAWKTVTFYLAAGDKDLSYRLEVFSGTREGDDTNAAGTYVMFDSNNVGTLNETTMTDLQNDVLTKVDKDNEDQVVYDTFSFYDTDKFLRYHKDADENNVGNSYAKYDQTTKTEGIAWMEYNNGNKSHVVFANFSFTDQTVDPDVVEDETEDDTTTEDETTTNNSEMNGWLLASSISIAAILLFAVVSIIVRRAVKQAKKNKAHAAATQPAKAKVQRPVKIRKVEKEEPKTEPLDENDPYND